MPTVLVTGANGFIGRALCAGLTHRKHNVRGVVRDLSRSVGLNCSLAVVGDIGPGTDWSAALDGIEAVVHLAARVHVMRERATNPLNEFREVNLRGTTRLAQMAAKVGVKRFVYISSIGVNGNKTIDTPFDESQRPHPHDLYAISKWEAEEELKQIAAATKMEAVVIRPPLVYGPANPGNFLRLLKLVERGLPLPLASIENRRSLIYLGNLVSAIVNCIESTAAAGQIYLISDGEDVSTAELIRRIAAAMGKQPRLFPMPEAALRMLGKLTGKSAEVSRLVDSLVVNSSKIRTELGWQPPHSLDDGLRATVEWYRQDRNTSP